VLESSTTCKHGVCELSAFVCARVHACVLCLGVSHAHALERVLTRVFVLTCGFVLVLAHVLA
jgi:hypothetical protein